MIQIEVKTLEELRAALGDFGEDALFRGQTTEYGRPDAPTMNTSFARNGCIPPLMFRWSHYATNIPSTLLGPKQSEVSLEFAQAILQHYGWRSFYLDASSNPEVSSWFAAHTFSSTRKLELCEDCFENPVFLRKLAANYSYGDGQGILYVLSKQALADARLIVIDLSSIELRDCRPRFHAQQAWLIGVLHDDLPTNCIAASIKGPRQVFRDFASSAGLTKTADVFPGIEEDPVLSLLMTLPWTEIRLPGPDKVGIPFFHQALELPEYEDSFEKHSPPFVAFYKTSWAIDNLPNPDIDFYRAPESIIFGSADIGDLRLPNVTKLIRASSQPHVVFEIDNLIRQPGLASVSYVKGLTLSKCPLRVVAVADFMVDHPGLKVYGCGINKGWHYKIDGNGTWSRFTAEEDCPCNNFPRHRHHLSALLILEDHLARKPGDITRQVSSQPK